MEKSGKIRSCNCTYMAYHHVTAAMHTTDSAV